jgi:hypothetical protein
VAGITVEAAGPPELGAAELGAVVVAAPLEVVVGPVDVLDELLQALTARATPANVLNNQIR